MNDATKLPSGGQFEIEALALLRKIYARLDPDAATLRSIYAMQGDALFCAEDCDIPSLTPRKIGKLLERCEARGEVDGIRVSRAGVVRAGILWKCVQV